jgi:hypothetical protein
MDQSAMRDPDRKQPDDRVPSVDRREAPQPPILDTRHLERQVHGDAGLRDELLHLYAAQLEALGPKIETATGGDLREIAHALKGASLAVGAFALAELCGGLDVPEGQATRTPRDLARILAATRDEVGQILGARG